MVEMANESVDSLDGFTTKNDALRGFTEVIRNIECHRKGTLSDLGFKTPSNKRCCIHHINPSSPSYSMTFPLKKVVQGFPSGPPCYIS